MTENAPGLVGWLLTQISEDERAARECAKVYPGDWEMSDRGHSAYVRADEPEFHIVTELVQEQVERGTVEWLGDALEHVARWDPARVLAECAAKRRIIEAARAADESCADHSGAGDNAYNGGYEVGASMAFDKVLRALALPYADRPGYQPEWGNQ